MNQGENLAASSKATDESGDGSCVEVEADALSHLASCVEGLQALLAADRNSEMGTLQ